MLDKLLIHRVHVILMIAGSDAELVASSIWNADQFWIGKEFLAKFSAGFDHRFESFAFVRSSAAVPILSDKNLRIGLRQNCKFGELS